MKELFKLIMDILTWGVGFFVVLVVLLFLLGQCAG